ncbi:MAG: hypothetical protein WCI87_08070 [Euryarchaeota archaeon]
MGKSIAAWELTATIRLDVSGFEAFRGWGARLALQKQKSGIAARLHAPQQSGQ